MSDSDQTVKLTLQIDARGQTTSDEVDATTRQLRDEITGLAVESVEIAGGGPAPLGTKSPEAVTLGALAVTLLPTVVPKLFDFLQAWLSRGEHRSLKIRVGSGDRAVEVEASSTVSATELKTILEASTKAARSINK